MKRRTMLLGSAGVGLAAYGGALSFGAMSPCAPYGSETAEIASARRIGERLLALGLEASTPPAGGAARLRSSLGTDMRRDFAGGHTVECDGWVLSRSEARYCVAVAREARETS